MAVETETWRPIPGVPDNYFASNLGRVRRGDKILMPVATRSGPYVYVAKVFDRMLRPQGRRGDVAVRLAVARLVAAAFYGRPPLPGLVVSYRDSDRTNTRADNLFWRTR